MLRILALILMGCATTADVATVEAELLKNVEEIRQTQLALLVLGEFTPCGDESSAQKNASTTARTWKGERCWSEVGWKPDQDVYGGYWVTVANDDFVVHGIGPKIGTNPRLHIIATKREKAHPKP